jgi:hypothetical protein
MLLVEGGQEYHGPTAERDKRVVECIAKALFARVGNTMEIITGGMPGIPHDFVRTWMAQGGKRVRFVVSEEHMDNLNEVEFGVTYEVAGLTQAERRQALTQIPGLTAALFIQGGQYTTDEIIKCQARGLSTLCFVGSGGASGGTIPYPTLCDMPNWARNSDPNADPEELGVLFANALIQPIDTYAHELYRGGLHKIGK